jgi:hypothetical protein
MRRVRDTGSGQVVRIVATLVGVGFLLPALFMFVVGAGFFLDEVDKTAETTGRITQVHSFTEPDGSVRGSCELEVAFEVEGEVHTTTSNVNTTGNCSRAIGEGVLVSYDPAEPSDNTAGSQAMKWIGLGLFAAGGVGMALVFLVLKWIYGKTAPAPLVVPDAGVVAMPPSPPSGAPSPTVAGWYPTSDGHAEMWFNGVSWDAGVTRPTSQSETGPGETETPPSGTH